MDEGHQLAIGYFREAYTYFKKHKHLMGKFMCKSHEVELEAFNHKSAGTIA